MPTANIRKTVLVILLTLLTRLFILNCISLNYQGDFSILSPPHSDGARYIYEVEHITNTPLSKLNILWDVPLYPLFLAFFFKLFGTSYFLASLLNIILFSMAVGIFYYTMLYSFGQRRALLATIIIIFYPTLLIDVLYLAAESLYLFLGAIAFLLLTIYIKSDKKIYIIPLAIILGLLTLTKEIFFYLPAVIAIIIFIHKFPDFKNALKTTALLAAIYGLVLLPLLSHNYRLSNGGLILSSKAQKVHARIIKQIGPQNKQEKSPNAPINKNSNFYIVNYFFQRGRFFLGTGTFGLMRAFGQDCLSLEPTADNPRAYFTVLRQYGLGWNLFQYSALIFIIYVFCSSAFSLFILLAKRKLRELAYFAIVFLYFLVALHYFAYNTSRYFIPFVPFLAFLSSYSTLDIYYFIRRRSRILSRRLLIKKSA